MWRLSLIEVSVSKTGEIKKRFVGRDLFCRKAYKSFLKPLGEAMVKYENYKKASEGVYYEYEISYCKDIISRMHILSENMLLEATQRNLCYLEEAKILKKRLCSV